MDHSQLRRTLISAAVLAAIVTIGAPTRAADVTPQRLLDADKNPADWLTYHGSYKSWHYSGLDQINASNVKNLKVAWTHVTPNRRAACNRFPLVADGVLYYSGSHNQIFALDGATGDLIWAYKQKLNEDLVAKQTHSPYNRGIAMGSGNIYMGTLDGKLVAVDMKTGKLNWETKLIESEKLTVGFTGAPLLVKDKVIIGSQGGEWPYRGPIFGVDASTGKLAWTVLHGRRQRRERSRAQDLGRRFHGRPAAAAAGWPAATTRRPNTVYWGTGQSRSAVRLGAVRTGRPPVRARATISTPPRYLALDPDTGKLKSYHQELPHDAWDFDSAVGEFVMLERDGKEYIVHPNKGGFVFVYDRNLKVQNVWQGVQNINFVKGIDPKTGELIGRRDMAEGKHQALCPYIAGGYSWNAGSYNPAPASTTRSATSGAWISRSSRPRRSSNRWRSSTSARTSPSTRPRRTAARRTATSMRMTRSPGK